jgi:hypothetical protein
MILSINKERIGNVNLENQVKYQIYLEIIIYLKRKVHVNIGQTVGREINVQCFIKNQTVHFSQNATKEINVSIITNN